MTQPQLPVPNRTSFALITLLFKGQGRSKLTKSFSCAVPGRGISR
jgi:hypothetical protein